MANHKWTRNDEKAALRAYLDGLSGHELWTIADDHGIKRGSFQMKLENFRYLDTGQGLSNASKLSREIWNEYKKTGKV